MKIAELNMFSYGSTGKIMLQIADTARKYGHTVKTYSTVPFDKKERSTADLPQDHFVWGSETENKIHYYLGSTFGTNGCYSKSGTSKLIRDLKKFDPDIIHLHNLHKFCINLPMLFRYIKSNNIRVIWTLHDCWAFTGHCPYFTMSGCDKWKTGCFNCPQLSIYPKSRIDNTRYMYYKKSRWFTGVKNMTVVTPSKWLAELVKQSFLKEYPVKVINNGIDLSVFRPRQSDFKRSYNIPKNKYIVLGVAFGWGERKGLDVFCELANRLDRAKYQIVLVGTNDETDTLLPENIISVHKTQNQIGLAEIYTAADLFVNPTREENYPTVNMEAIACGTPVLTFKTGGSPEIIGENTGSVVLCDDIDALESEIIRICTTSPYSADNCTEYAKTFDMNEKFEEYVKLYEDCTYIAERTL